MTSAYSKSLDILRSKAAHELKEVGDQWRTPDHLFWGINAMFGPLVLDLFADNSNAKCPTWYTAEDNALTQDWAERLAELGGGAYANPPYSRSQYHEKQAVTGMTHIINHAMAMREKGGRYVFLIKAATSETWWPDGADHIAFIRGRIGFDLPSWFIPADEKQQPSGAFFAGAIAVFDKSWRGERFSYIQRTDLEAKGRAFMALAQFAAGKILPISEPVKPSVKVEPELPLHQKDILAKSGIETWACVRATFGDKEEYTFNESKFGHTWASDCIDSPEIITVPAETIAMAKILIREMRIKTGLNDWLTQQGLPTEAACSDVLERMCCCAIETDLPLSDFIRAVDSLDKGEWFNIRSIRSHIRSFIEAGSVGQQQVEDKIFPLEVTLLFRELPELEELQFNAQIKIKNLIHSRWLERTAREDIIADARELLVGMAA